MSFEPGRRHGRYWEDAKKLHKLLDTYPFHTTGKSERDFENGLASALMMTEKQFTGNVITQIEKGKKVESVFCFGKKHRPDMTLDDDGIAIELKYIRYAGLKEAIGQGFFYRIKYRFVFLILVISEDRKRLYEDICRGEEKDMEDLLNHLADKMNIFTYIVPAFVVNQGMGMKRCHSFFEWPTIQDIKGLPK